MRLFHGTSADAATAIMAQGFIRGPVYLTPRREMAEEYGPCVIEVDVPISSLRQDYTAQVDDDEDIAEWLRRGKSAYTNGDVEVR